MTARPSLKIEKAVDHESVFLSHHAWLQERARSLVHGAKDEAEDLVQDLYVRFVLSRADVDLTDEIRLQGYLLRALRNLCTDRHRSRERDPLRSLQTVDFDSMEMALAAVDRSRLLYIRSDLAGICEYACLRRGSSKVGSALILRFFLGYFPSEIAALLRTSPIAVHKLIETARLEAHAFLKRPGSLHLPGQKSLPKVSLTKRSLPDDPAALFARLRNRIFATVEGSCLPAKELDALYAEGESRPLTTKSIAHLVSCRTCLERANQLLGFPDLSKRTLDDPNDRDDRNSPPRSGSPGRESIEKMRKKLRGTREHRPKTLEISIDGRPRAAQEVTSSLSRFHIPLKESFRPKYISVLSEQGHCLLYLDLEEEGVPQLTSIRKEIALSDARSLVLEINPSGSSSVIDLTYHDLALDTFDAEGETWACDDVPPSPFERPERSVPAPERSLQFIKRFWTALARWLSDGDSRLPSCIAAAVLMSMLMTFLIIFSPQQRNNTRDLPSAPALLAQAESSALRAVPAGGAVHRTFAYEVRGGDGKLLESRTVETLRSNVPARSVSRLIGPGHRTIAGRWTNASGEVTTYSSQDGVEHSRLMVPEPMTSRDIWLEVPDASDFDHLIPEPARIHVERQQGRYELLYDKPEAKVSPSLVHAELVLSGDDLRATAETLRFKEGKVLREYHFQELTYEVLPASRISERDFEPDTALLSPSSETTVPIPSVGTSAHLTLAALELLDNLGSDVERVVNLQRTDDGRVELNGVFPTTDERNAVGAVFQSLNGGRRLLLDLHASDETPASSQVPKAIQVESLEVDASDTQQIPFDSEIRPFFERQGLAGAEREKQIRQMAHFAVTHSAQLHRESWSLCQIAAHDFSLEELQSLQPDDQVLWLALLDRHLRAFDAELTILHSELAPIWRESHARFPDPPSNSSSLGNIGELKDAAVILNHDSERLDHLLTNGFTLSPSILPANYNLSDVAQLISDLHSEEDTLRNTFDHLRSSRLAEPKR